MNNPLLKTVRTNFPDVDLAALPWPADADTWEAKDLELFIGSGGFLKPKKKKAASVPATGCTGAGPTAATPSPAKAAATAAAAAAVSAAPVPAASLVSSPPEKARPAAGTARLDGEEDGTAQATEKPKGAFDPAPRASASGVVERPSGFEVPGFSVDRCAITLPVRIHCEDTTRDGHVRLESLTAYAERLRSLALKQIMGLSLADLKQQALAILATEYVVEIVGSGIRVLDTLRIDSTPEFPATPMFPWDTTMHTEDGDMYAKGMFGLNLCQISPSGQYSGIDEAGYEHFVQDFRKFCNPRKKNFSATSMRFFSAYPSSGKPFKPTEYKQVTYIVRGSDCDMYNVLFQARVPSMMESCYHRRDALAMYVNIRTSVRPDDELQVHVMTDADSALFICMRGAEAVLTAFGHYGVQRPMVQEELKCASFRLPLLLKFLKGQSKPAANSDFDLSNV